MLNFPESLVIYDVAPRVAEGETEIKIVMPNFSKSSYPAYDIFTPLFTKGVKINENVVTT